MTRPDCAAVLAVTLLGGCALVAPAPPEIQVVSVDLRDLDLLDQVFDVELCVRNMDRAELAFRHVAVTLDLAGAKLAHGDSDAPIHVAARAATLVPVTVTTTVRNLEPQLLDVLGRGELDYRVHGAVTLSGAFAITVPFSRTGQFDLLQAGQRMLADASEPKSCAMPAS